MYDCKSCLPVWVSSDGLKSIRLQSQVPLAVRDLYCYARKLVTGLTSFTTLHPAKGTLSWASMQMSRSSLKVPTVLLYFIIRCLLMSSGGPGHTMIASFSSAVFICGGSGLSLGLSSVEDLVFKDARSVSRVKTIELVWLIQDPCASCSVDSLS